MTTKLKITLIRITVRELCDRFHADAVEAVGYGNRLDIRPKYQRDFIYSDKKRNAVIDTVKKGFPLNAMYWVRKNDGTFEVLDGQQRSISIGRYVTGDFSIDEKYFHTLTNEAQKKILDYRLMVYICEGPEEEKLEWFRTINIAGEVLTPQELRNAVYAGAWLAAAKVYFCHKFCPAAVESEDYVQCKVNRQELLELALKWIGDAKYIDRKDVRADRRIEQYMADHQNDTNASELWLYFRSVIEWVRTTFPTYRREMKGLPWGELYNQYKDIPLDIVQLEAEVAQLMQDDDVTNRRGIYLYVLDHKERHLNIRAFGRRESRRAYEQQQGNCALCGKHFRIEEMEADHIVPWHVGGKTVAENCQMLCRDCNRRKSGK